MGLRRILFATAISVPAFVPSVLLAQPQAAGAEAKGKAHTPTWDAVTKTRRNSDVIRPPVRREVHSRKAKRPSAAPEGAPAAAAVPSPPPVGGGATTGGGGGAVTSSRKTWPIIPNSAATAGAGAAAGAAAAGAAAVPSAQQEAAWTPAEIAEATAKCAAVLRGVDAVMVPQDPIKEGACGSPVVYLVSGVGKSPSVEISPPVQLTCEMVAAMDTWMKLHVQPKARALVGGPVVRISTMSSYSCRNAYGRRKTRLSEHGKANAIDIGGFQTSRDTVSVLAHWGPTEREIKAIAARREAERAAAAAAKAGAGQSTTGSLPRAVDGSQGGAPVPNVPGVVISSPDRTFPSGDRGLGLGPSRLGGPKANEARLPEAPAMAVPSASTDPRARFLKDIHESACKVFGTVLGPEANNAHKNHFHLDMAQRNRGNFCE
jgi:hypothetical protein